MKQMDPELEHFALQSACSDVVWCAAFMDPGCSVHMNYCSVAHAVVVTTLQRNGWWRVTWQCGS